MLKTAVALSMILLFAACAVTEQGPQSEDTVEEAPPAEDTIDYKTGPAGRPDTLAQVKADLKAGKNFPQEELAKRKDALKISGIVEVPGYKSGTIQIDVYYPNRVQEGHGPLTTAHFKAPGAYELLLPPEVKQVSLMAILDFDSNGPDASDATAEYVANPVHVHETSIGLNFTIDKDNVKAPPPKTSSRTESADDLPPWEKEGDAKGAPAEVKHEVAAPGAPGGDPSHSQ